MKMVISLGQVNHCFQAIFTLLVLASKEGWIDIAYNGIDAVGIDKQPIQNYSETKVMYFVSFLLFVGFLLVNLFVGVVVESLHRLRLALACKERAMRIAAREKRFQHKWRRMSELPYYLHFSPCRRYLHRVCTSKYFDLIIAIVIGLNVITMSLEHYHMSPVSSFFLSFHSHPLHFIFLII